MLEHDLILAVGLGLALIHGLGVLSAIHAVASVRTPQGAIAWAVSLVTFPYLALPLYWIFGRDRFHGYVDALRQAPLAGADERVAALVRGLRTHEAKLPAVRAADLSVLARLSGTPFTRGNALQLLIDGEATFAAIFAAIESAEHACLVQSFIVKDDGLGRRLQALLLRKAAAGVRVYLLYDEIGSHALPRAYGDRLRAAGVRVSAFHTTHGRRNRFQINFRNHRKIVAVDGHTAFVGGHNVGDEYLGLGPLGHWRDTHLRVQGPAALALQLVFAADWHWATGTMPEVLWELPPPDNAAGSAGQAMLIYPTGPADTLDKCSMFFHQAIAGARRRLWIASPYFVPDAAVFTALQLAALRGVDVRVLLPAKPDHLLVYLASFSFLDAADRTGIQVYRYQEGFLHQKVVLVDDEVASIGSANLDNRSLRLNFEVTAVTVDAGLAAQVQRMLEEDFRHARRTSAKDLGQRGWAFRWGVRAARLLDPIL
jgi:cardiolipin synthase A/B